MKLFFKYVYILFFKYIYKIKKYQYRYSIFLFEIIEISLKKLKLKCFDKNCLI